MANSYIARDQKFEFKLAGLKPNTKHYFYFDGVNKSSSCQRIDGKIGQNLYTDSSGNMHFYFYYRSEISPKLDLTAELALASKIAGVKKVLVASADGTSYAETTITFAALNPATTTAINTNRPTSSVLSTL